VLLNDIAQMEHTRYLQANVYVCMEDQKGYAVVKKDENGQYTDARDNPTPRLREGGFCPLALETRPTSELALPMVPEVIFVQGGYTRKVRRITEELCGVEVSAMEVSRVVAKLNEILCKWRKRSLEGNPSIWMTATKKRGKLDECVMRWFYWLWSTPAGERRVVGVSVSLSDTKLTGQLF